jgi:uncharacterized protein YodC (DUF2158 family)
MSEMNSPKFNVGDEVTHKAGSGQKMIVIREHSDGSYQCEYLDPKTGDQVQRKYMGAVLEPYSVPQIIIGPRDRSRHYL